MSTSDDSDALAVVYASQGPLGAEVAISKLRAHGIEAISRYQSVGRVIGVTVDGLGLVEVLVKRENEQAALNLLTDTE